MRTIAPIVLVLLFNLTICLSQNKTIRGVVIDNNTEKPLAFVNIGIFGTPKGTYTDFRGKFELVLQNKDSIAFTHIGYERFVLSQPEIFKDSLIIRLKPMVFSLDEISVVSDRIIKSKSSKIELGYLENVKPILLGIGSPGIQFAEYIPNTLNVAGIIEKIIIRLRSKELNRVRFNIYAAFPDGVRGPQQSILREDLTMILKRNRGKLRIDISDQQIPFPKNGVYVSIEFLGDLDENMEFIPREGNAPFSSHIFTGRGSGNYRTWSTIHNMAWSEHYPSYLNRTNVLIGLEVNY